MAHTNDEATSQGFDRKWALFFLATMMLIVGAFLVQRFVFSKASVETRGEQGSTQEQPQRPEPGR